VFGANFSNRAYRTHLNKIILYLGPVSGKNHPELKTAMFMRAASFPAF
jgi:hypothetical protein